MTNYEDYDDYEDRLKYLDPSDIKKYKIQNGSGLFLTAFDGKFVFEPQVVCNLNDSYSINVFEILYCFFEERPEVNVEVDVFITHISRDILNFQIRTSNQQKVLKNLHFWYPRKEDL